MAHEVGTFPNSMTLRDLLMLLIAVNSFADSGAHPIGVQFHASLLRNQIIEEMKTRGYHADRYRARRKDDNDPFDKVMCRSRLIRRLRVARHPSTTLT